MDEQQPQPHSTLLMRPTRALISTALIVALAAGVVLGFSALANHLSSAKTSGQSSASSSSATSASQGVLLGGTPAPTFSLTDQNGAPVTLDSLKGKPTVFTFFDSVCPHTDCSLMAQYINFTATNMGGDMSKVNWVALSLNPWHDTRQSVKAFISNQQLKPNLIYLMGSVDQLQPLWDAFHMQSIEQSDGIVIHTTGVYVLDNQAHELVFMDEGFDPHALSADIEQVLTKGDSAFTGQQGAQTTNAITQTHSIGNVQVTLTCSPAQYGSYDFTVLLQTASAQAVPNANVSLDLTMPSMVMQPVHVDLQPIAPVTAGAYRATGVLSMAGQWVVNVNVTPRGATQPSVSVFSFTAKY